MSVEQYLHEDVVIATKYSTNFKAGPHAPHIMANFTGNGAKSLHGSVEASLRKLQTSYIDLVHPSLIFDSAL